MKSNVPVRISIVITGALLVFGCIPPARRQPLEQQGPQNRESKPSPSLATPPRQDEPVSTNTLSVPTPDSHGGSDSLTSAKVVGVQDGDTITVIGIDKAAIRIRLAGIDAPEKGRPYWDRSKSNLSDLVYGKIVTLECKKVDRYNRPVCKVFLNGEDISLRQIQDGMAWHYKRYENEQSEEDRIAYAEAEEKARVERKGLWKDALRFPVTQLGSK